MTAKSSRAYKLKLSNDGITLFLRCHSRICLLVHDFLPYGTTLHVCVATLASLSTDDLTAEASASDLGRYAGKEIRFVGTSALLAATTSALADRIAASGRLHPVPQSWKLFLAALRVLQATDDGTIIHIYDALCALDPGMKPRRLGRQSPALSPD